MSAKRIASLCPIEELLVLIGGRWKPVILWWLMSNTVPLRFTILRTKMPRISRKVLTQQLWELQRDALIKKADARGDARARRILVDAVWKEAPSGSPGARFLGQKAHTATEGRDTVLYDFFNCQKPLTFLCPPCGRETLVPWSIYWNCQNKQERDVKKFAGRWEAGRRGARYGCATENSSVQY